MQAAAAVLVAAIAVAAIIFSKITGHSKWTGPRPAIKRALLVIAHPDDESLFFVPSVRSLVQDGWEVGMLCLSNGEFREH